MNSIKKNRFSHKKKLAISPTFHETTSKLKNEVSILQVKNKIKNLIIWWLIYIFKKKNGCKKIQIEVHRAAGIYEYENTLKAVTKAIEMGMDKIEIDVYKHFL